MNTIARRFRLLLFIDSLGSGGAQRQLATLANALAGAGHAVTLVTYYPFWHYRNDLDSESVDVVYLPRRGRFDIFFIFRLARLLYILKPDAVLSYLFTPNILIRLASLLYLRRCGVVTSERNIDLQRSGARMRIERVISRLSDVIVTNAEATRNLLLENRICPPDKVRVIPNGVDISGYRVLSETEKTAVRERFCMDEKKFTILLPGRIQEQKNHACLLRALSLVADAASRCQALFVGDIIDSELKHTLDDFINLKLRGVKVHFAGQCDDMNGVYEIADLVVLPSQYEGLPNVVIEAMYKSKLVAVSNVSDNLSIVHDGVTGFVHDVDDEKALARIIESAMRMSHDELDKIRAAAHREFMRRYTVDALLRNYEDVFAQVIARRA